MQINGGTLFAVSVLARHRRPRTGPQQHPLRVADRPARCRCRRPTPLSAGVRLGVVIDDTRTGCDRGSVQPVSAAMAVLDFLARAAGARLVAPDLVRMAHRLPPQDLGPGASGGLPVPLREPVCGSPTDGIGQAVRQGVVLVQRQLLLLEAVPAHLGPVEQDRRPPLRLADEHLEPTVAIELHPLQETGVPVIA
jgi:hypothetical protein